MRGFLFVALGVAACDGGGQPNVIDASNIDAAPDAPPDLCGSEITTVTPAAPVTIDTCTGYMLGAPDCHGIQAKARVVKLVGTATIQYPIYVVQPVGNIGWLSRLNTACLPTVGECGYGGAGFTVQGTVYALVQHPSGGCGTVELQLLGVPGGG